MSVQRFSSAIRPLPVRPRPLLGASRQAGGTPLLKADQGPREAKQKVLDGLLNGANANKVRDIATGRPDLIEAASPEQRARMVRTMLDKLFFGSADRQAILAVLRPAGTLGEMDAALGALGSSGKRPALFSQMGDEGEGLDLARLLLANKGYNDRNVIVDAGLTGTRALVRVASDEQLDGLPSESKVMMISALQKGPDNDETRDMISRIRHHMG